MSQETQPDSHQAIRGALRAIALSLSEQSSHQKAEPIDNADLLGHILHMCPGTWQAQYKLKADTVPQDVHDLLDDLEKIKKVFPTEQEQPGKKGKSNPSDTGKRKMVSIHEPIPKKPHTNVKHCALCKKHAGTHATHNMSDCCRYDKDGTLKKSFGKGQSGSMASDKKTASTFEEKLAIYCNAREGK